jgi:hypothetical protein
LAKTEADGILLPNTPSGIAESAVSPEENSLFGQTNSLFWSRTANHAQGTGTATQTDVGSGRNVLKWSEVSKNSLLFSLF